MSEQPPIRRFDVEIVDEAPKPPLGAPVGQDPDFMHNVYKHHDHDHHDHHDHEAHDTPRPVVETQAASSADFLGNFIAEQDHDTTGEGQLIDDLVAALRDIYDPEIPVNIYDLGLIYDVQANDGHVSITMTLTTPHCPVAESMPGEVEMRVLAVPGVATCDVDLVWDPPWNPASMSDEAKLELGML